MGFEVSNEFDQVIPKSNDVGDLPAGNITNVESQRQLENSQAKLLEDRLRNLDVSTAANQLKEEIIRFESHRAPANT